MFHWVTESSYMLNENVVPQVN